jgi:hypothetical protein
MRLAFVLVIGAAVALSTQALATTQPEIFFPAVKVLPRQDRTAHGSLYPSIVTRSPAFCWELDLFTRRQPLYGYLRRVGSSRVVSKLYLGNNQIPPQPWRGSSHYSGCDAMPRADERAFLRRPRLYYLDIRTRRATHAAMARPHGPPLHL